MVANTHPVRTQLMAARVCTPLADPDGAAYME